MQQRFLLQILLLAHYALHQELKSIKQWLLPVVFGYLQQRFLLQILLLAQHVSGITMPIISSSRVLYSGCCLWYFVLWFFK